MSAARSQGSSFFLEEIVFNILTRLPVKSICRCKCVCKTWLSIISAQPFVDSHSARAKSHPKLLVAIYREKPRDFFIADSVPERHLFIANPAPEQDEDGSSLVVVLRQSVTMPTMPAKSCAIAWDFSPGDSQSVGGLMFSLCSQKLIRIANPSTNKCILFYPQNYSPCHDKVYRYVSLGFDPVEGKHKLLESLSFVSDYDERVKRTEHRVITVGDDTNCWRCVKDGPFIDRGEYGGNEICINGVIYFTAWVYWNFGGNELCIVAFDVRTESFQAVKLSMKGRFNYSPYPWMYVEFEGKVAIVDYPLSNRDCCFYLDDCEHALELWVLEDFEKQIWILKFAALPPLPMKTDDMIDPKHKLVGTTHDGELIFAVFEKGSYFGKSIRKVTEEEKGVPFSFLFFDMKTGDFRSSKVRLPEGFALTGNIKITAMGHVETLMSI